jgi:hypothetical protein
MNGSWRREHFRKARAFAVHEDRLFVAINLDNAGDLGIEIPPNILALATW